MIPISRTQERDEQTGRRICYTRSCPHYYLDEAGALNAINLQPRVTTAKTGAVSVMDRNVRSVGHRLDGDPYKFAGLRPDLNQRLGTEQLEFSLGAIRVDGDLLPVDLSRRAELSNVLTEFDGRLYLHTTRQAMRQMVRVPSTVKTFEMETILHLKGLRVVPKGGEYWFLSKPDGSFRFRIRGPHVLDLDRRGMASSGLRHSLTDNGDGTWTYRKWADALTLQPHPWESLPAEVLIDADTYYATTEDGCVDFSDSVWATCRAGTDGQGLYSTDHFYDYAIHAQEFNIPPTIYGIGRSFFAFNTSGATAPTAVDQYIYSTATALQRSSVCAMLGTQGDTLELADYDAFSGNEYGHVAWAANQYNVISYNAQGIADLNVEGTTYVCCREYDHDYLNSAPPDANGYFNSAWYANEEGTTKDPYLSVTESEPPPSGPPLGTLAMMRVGR